MIETAERTGTSSIGGPRHPVPAPGSTTHELNNWLGIILGNATLLRIDLDESHSASLPLDDICHTVREAAALVRRLDAELHPVPLGPDDAR